MLDSSFMLHIVVDLRPGLGGHVKLMELVDLLCNVDNASEQNQSLIVHCDRVRASTNRRVGTLYSCPLLLAYDELPCVLKHIVEVISTSKKNHLISNSSNRLSASWNWELKVLFNLMVRVVFKELLPFVSWEVVDVEVVMSDSIDESSKQIEVVPIETDGVIVSSRWNVTCCVFLSPLERVHVELVHVLVVLPLAIGTSNHVHALGIDACLVMGERPRRVSLEINLLP